MLVTASPRVFRAWLGRAFWAGAEVRGAGLAHILAGSSDAQPPRRYPRRRAMPGRSVHEPPGLCRWATKRPGGALMVHVLWERDMMRRHGLGSPARVASVIGLAPLRIPVALI